jgi:hypothetical protein
MRVENYINQTFKMVVVIVLEFRRHYKRRIPWLRILVLL